MESVSETPKSEKEEWAARGVEYQEHKRRIIEPLPNGRLVSYSKPLIELKDQSNKRYEIICDQISISGDGSSRILVTMGNELVRFQNDTVSLCQERIARVWEVPKRTT